VASGHDAPLMAALRPQVSCTRCQMGTRSHEHPPTAAPLRPPSGSRWRHPCRSSGPSSLQRRLFCDRSTLWMGPVLGPPAGALYCTFNALLSTTPVWYSMRLCPYRRSTLFVIKRQGILDFLLLLLLSLYRIHASSLILLFVAVCERVGSTWLAVLLHKQQVRYCAASMYC
jgi:hypothetical protein